MAQSYRSTKQYIMEEVESMGIVSIHVKGKDDGMVYAILSPEDFAQNYEVIPE